MSGVAGSVRRMGSGRVSDEMVARAAASVSPVTLPMQAYGPDPIEWFYPPRPVWAWVQWPNRPAERLPARAVGANDRVVVLEVPCDGGHWSPVVWRNAVTVRTNDK